jgi:tetratricopeptide (TPR) repeat protein
MSNRSHDILFQLIKSLEKAEKRHFKLYIKRSSAKEDLKIVRLFDAIDKLDAYDEKYLLKKLPGTEKRQLYNLKTHLYKEILASLRLLKSADSIDLQLHEQFDYAHILYKKGLFLQSLKILEKAKEMARTNQKYNFLTQVISLEKRIETLHITRSMQDRAEQLSQEAMEITTRNQTVAQLSNLALKLYSWYTRHGHARNEEDENGVREFLQQNLPPGVWEQNGFYERLYLYQSMSWYAFIRQDFLMYYRYAQKWVDLFHNQRLMIRVETGHYIKGLHNLLNAHFDLRNFREFEKTLKLFEEFSHTDRVQDHDNFRIQAFIYTASAKINQHFMIGTFKEGLLLVPDIEQKLKEYAIFLDSHRVMVINYKIAMLYFGSQDYKTSIDYLQKIIYEDEGLGNDLQCYARLVHLMSHYELGNDSIIESLTKSVYRFMAKMQNLTVVEEGIFQFLKKSWNLSPRQLKPELEKLLQKIKHLEKNRFETRAFAYLDIISWLEGKVTGKPMGAIINEKYLQSKRKFEEKRVTASQLKTVNSK